MRKKRSFIWLIAIEELLEIVSNASTITEILKKLGKENKGGNYKTLQARLAHESIDYSHIKLGLNSNKGRVFKSSKTPIEQLLIKNSSYNRFNLKKRLVNEGLLVYKCFICSNSGKWHNKSLTLQLDHINGVSNDNRLENLRFLCPNCHSQTQNFAGKTRKEINEEGELYSVPRRKIRKSEIDPNWRSAPRPGAWKIERPSKEELYKMVWQIPTAQIAKQLGISDTALVKWCRAYEIKKPPRGYWQKQGVAKMPTGRGKRKLDIYHFCNYCQEVFLMPYISYQKKLYYNQKRFFCSRTCYNQSRQ